MKINVKEIEGELEKETEEAKDRGVHNEREAN